jgi:RNA polymerase sigma-70 factor (ECF subfamily)
VPVRAEMTDNSLVELILAGDTYAFEQIFDRHKRLVAGVSARYFRRQEEIEEIVQTAFAKAYHELPKFRGEHERSFASWLVRITSNICFDTLRDQRRKPETLATDLSEHEAEAILMITADHSRRAEEELAEQDLIEKLLSKLPADDRALLQMFYGEEMSVAEIADTLGLTQSNVKVRAWRARRNLRKYLKRLM